MGVPVLVLGRSGSGKSSSARNFRRGEALVISAIGKPLPFREKLRQVNTRNYRQVCVEVRDAPENAVILDDAGYLITGEFMDGHSAPRSGSSVFDLYNHIADNFWKLFRFIVDSVPADKVVYIMMHVERADDGWYQPKTVGRLLNEKVDIPGMVTVCLFAEFADGRYVFHTRNHEFTTAKCPPDMELPDTMDNDLKAVDAAIRDYWQLAPIAGEVEADE